MPCQWTQRHTRADLVALMARVVVAVFHEEWEKQ